MCIEVLEHLPYPVEALLEFGRLLRPNGTLVITAPFCSLTHYAPYFYQTGYSRYFYEYWLEKLGFKIVEIKWNGNFFEYVGQELRRLPSVGNKYTGASPTWLEYIALNIVLGLLNRFSKNDLGSEQLLAYGLQIVAKKLDNLDS